MLADKVSDVPGSVRLHSSAGLDRWQTQQKTGDTFLAAGYSDILTLQIVLAAAVKTLSNDTNHLCKTELDDKFAGYKV